MIGGNLRHVSQVIGLGLIVAWGAGLSIPGDAKGLPCMEEESGSTVIAGGDPEAREVPFISAAEAMKGGAYQIVIPASVWPDSMVIAGVTVIEDARLPGLIRSTPSPIVVAGSGYSDHVLARRLARWHGKGSSIAVIHGGVAALALQSDTELSDADLANLLAVPPNRQMAVADDERWNLLTLDEAELPAVVSVRESGSDLRSMVAEVLRNESGSVALVDATGANSRSRALFLSREFDYPVFYLDGGARRFRSEFSRFQALNRHPGVSGNKSGCAG